MQIGINSSGTTFYARKPGRVACGKYSGTYKGQMSPEQLKRVSDMVNNCVPDRFWPRSGYDDAAVITYRFYYNNEVKTRIGQSMPYLGLPLAFFLDSIPYNVALHKISDSVVFIK